MKYLYNVHGFFSDYYLGTIFGQTQGCGRRQVISHRENDYTYNRFRRLHERAEGRINDTAACRERFLRPLLRDILGYHLGMGKEGIHGLYQSAAAEQSGEFPLLLAYCGAWDEDLDAGRGHQNPRRRLEQLMIQLELSYGLLLTGERVRLIRAPGEGPRGAYLEVDLAGLAEDEDPESFAAFLHLFSVTNFLPDGDGCRPIERIEAESRGHAERVSENLKDAVFTAAETMVSGLVEDAVIQGRLTSPFELNEVQLRTYRDAALLALYRILFILYAEARDPRLEGHELYQKSYSAQGLLEEILHDPERIWPENRCYFWERLRVLFRIYDEGLLPITSREYIPPRGSDFFSRTTPEGEILDAARIPDRDVARVLLELATTKPRQGVGRERISFRELDIEQLGGIYEGLLEYEPHIIRETSIDLRVQGREFVLTPVDVTRLCKQKGLRVYVNPQIIQGLTAEGLHLESSNEEDEEDEETEEISSEKEEPLVEEDEAAETEEGVKKGARAYLVRRLDPGKFCFIPGTGRKGSGSFYTPRALVQDLVHHALGPLIKGKSAAEIERIRVLDPACGSAHFLVEAMRFLGQALHRAYVEEYGGKAPPDFRSTTNQGWDTDWRASDEEARSANSEARAWCKRRIAERCLFGVDLNPTAVQLARVALWIESVAGDRPLSYFQHHIRCGNSLLGSSLGNLEHLPLSRKKRDRNQRPLPFQDPVRQAIREAARLRRLIDEVRPEDLRCEGYEPESREEHRYKDDLLKEAEATITAAKLLFNLRSASAFVSEIGSEWEKLCNLIHDPEGLRRYAQSRPWWREFERVCARERFFHWELEFPEVFLEQDNPGFDTVLGNPPWDKIKPERKEFYGRYDVLIRAFVGGELDRRIKELHQRIPTLADEFKDYEVRVKTLALCLKKGGDYYYQDWEVDGKSTGGDPDAFKFFVERTWQLVRNGGRVGFVVPSAIYNNEGCTGLRHLLLSEAQVERFYAFENRKKIFPIDSRQKFVSLVFRKGKPEVDGFEAAFMRHDFSELENIAYYRDSGNEKVKPFPAPWIVPVRRRELERLSLGTLAFLEYRSPRDREILLKMYGYDAEGNPVNPRPLLGDQGPGTWNARFYREFDMTNDRDLWTDPKTGKLYNPRQVLGSIPGTTGEPPYYEPAAWSEIRARMAEKGFWPLYEGKHIEQFLVDIKPIERWVSLEAAERKYGKPPDPGPKLVFRDIARNTNERTCIAAVLPERSCFGHTLSGVTVNNNPDEVVMFLNSFCFDYGLRFRTAGTHLSFTYVARMPVGSLQSPTYICTRSGNCGKIDHISEIHEAWLRIWLANWAVANTYGLTSDDFEYILTTFPVFARKRPEFYSYLLERVMEWKKEVGLSKRLVYSIGTSTQLVVAAEKKIIYSKDKTLNREQKIHVSRASLRFRQAAVWAWVVNTLYDPGYPVSRLRIEKMLYLIEQATQLGLFQGFLKQAAGPYDPGLRYKGPEDIAVRQRQWLVATDERHFMPGPNIAEAIGYAGRYLDLTQAFNVIKKFRKFTDEALERWTTVDMAARDLAAKGQPVTVESVRAYLESIPKWRGKLERMGFKPEFIASTLVGLRRFGFLRDGNPINK